MSFNIKRDNLDNSMERAETVSLDLATFLFSISTQLGFMQTKEPFTAASIAFPLCGFW